jgi:two-component system response regulator NreC
MTTIRVVLADDHVLVREGVAALLEQEADLSVVGQAKDADEAVALCTSLRPEVAVLDLSMPGGGVEAIARIVAASSGTRCLALTMHDDPAYLSAVIAAGGLGYLLKGAASEELVGAIRVVARGQSYVRVTGAVLNAVAEAKTRMAVPLSVRERQVLAGVARGFSNREIAEQLGLGVKTVETYRARLQDKLGASGRASLVDYALRVGVLKSL